MTTLTFQTRVVTPYHGELLCAVVARMHHEDEGERGLFVYAEIEHVQALEDVWDSDDLVIRDGDDIVARLERIEIRRLESEAEGRYDRASAWEYAKATA